MDNGASSYRRFLDGDDLGMVELVRDYKDGLLLYLNSYTNDLSIAEDCVQDTFIKLATKTPKFNERSSFKTWLYAIGRNIVISHIRKMGKKEVSLDEIENVKAETDLENNYLIEERKIILYQSIRKLKSDYQKVIVLTYFEDFSVNEICKIMHKSKKQINNLLYNAKKALKSELEKENFHYEKLWRNG